MINSLEPLLRFWKPDMNRGVMGVIQEVVKTWSAG